MDLYVAILARRSVRRYDRRPLDGETLARVREIAAEVRPLAPLAAENRFQVLFRDVAPGENLVETLGAYGRIVSPPHLLVPYLSGSVHPLTDLGYRAQQIVVRLTALGLGSCYVGCLSREEEARASYGLEADARLGAAVVYGYPATGRGNRMVNATVRRLVGATHKKPAERLFFDGAWGRPAAPPPELADLIEAARHAPSADNAQPWRFLWRDGALYLYVLHSSWRYRVGGTQDYRLHDGGICMANVSLAMEALGVAGQWAMLGEDDPALACPAELEPLAMLRLA
jgi:nitroreductase